MATGIQVTFDAADPAALGGFWAEALGYIEQPPPDGFDSWDAFLDSIGVPADQRDTAYAIIDPDGDRPRIYFQKVPEAKTVKNRVHLDLNVAARGETPMSERRETVDAEVTRLVGLGATRHDAVDRDNEYWVVMTDPEGNEFCVQ
jgi:hypothetical protein